MQIKKNSMFFIFTKKIVLQKWVTRGFSSLGKSEEQYSTIYSGMLPGF